MKVMIEFPDDAREAVEECIDRLNKYHILSCGAYMTVECPTEDGGTWLAWRIVDMQEIVS